MVYIVGFNGPPRSGKDECVKQLLEVMATKATIPVQPLALSTPLRRIAYTMARVEGQSLNGEDYEKFKTTHFPQFGRTGRQLMIDISERFLKPCYGDTVMSQLLLEEVRLTNSLVLISDTGFQREFGWFVKMLGGSQTCVVQVHRPGFEFEDLGDSREWVRHPLASRNRVVRNDKGIPHLRRQMEALYASMTESFGWKL